MRQKLVGTNNDNEMPLCFYVTHALQFFSSNICLKFSKLGTKRQSLEGESGEGRDFWFGGHKPGSKGGPVFTYDNSLHFYSSVP